MFMDVVAQEFSQGTEKCPWFIVFGDFHGKPSYHDQLQATHVISECGVGKKCWQLAPASQYKCTRAHHYFYFIVFELGRLSVWRWFNNWRLTSSRSIFPSLLMNATGHWPCNFLVPLQRSSCFCCQGREGSKGFVAWTAFEVSKPQKLQSQKIKGYP